MVKECPEGKVLNPKTNRCIKNVNSVKKECPAGKVLNPKTNRCIKDVKNVNSVKSVKKECPEGKVLNPKTNRCIKVVNDVNSVKSVKKECPKGKVLNPTTNRCIKDVPICGEGEVLRDGKCVCGKNHIWDEKKQKCVCPTGLTYNKKNGYCRDDTDYNAVYYNIISKFPKTYKVYMNIPYKNKDKAKELGAKWDYLEKKWYYTEETKLGVINKLNYLSFPKPNVYNVKISIYCKDDLKKLGLHWDANAKSWYYFSNLPEENKGFILKYDWNTLCMKIQHYS
jgi:hypothetical protein